MRSLYISLVLLFICALASAQEPSGSSGPSANAVMAMAEAPLVPPPPRINMVMMKNLIKHQVSRAIDGKAYPSVAEWQPLSTRQKFDVFLHSTYAPSTFANAAIDEAADRAKAII